MGANTERKLTRPVNLTSVNCLIFCKETQKISQSTPAVAGGVMSDKHHMKDVYDLVKEHEANLEEFIEWQINHGPTNDFRAFAELNVKAQDIFKYASVLYPKFILVEESVVLKDHYSDDNWKEWRKTHDSKSAAKETEGVKSNIIV